MKNRSPSGAILSGGLKEDATAWGRIALLVGPFVLLSAPGGDCLDDMERLRGDKGLEAMLGYLFPAPETARKWLDKFRFFPRTNYMKLA